MAGGNRVLWRIAPQTQTLHCYMLHIADIQHHMSLSIIGISSFIILDVALWVCRRTWLQAPKDDSAGVQVS